MPTPRRIIELNLTKLPFLPFLVLTVSTHKFIIGLPDRWPIPNPRFRLVLFKTLLAAVIISGCHLDMTLDAFVNAELLSLDSSCQTTTFDYIIVGAGRLYFVHFHNAPKTTMGRNFNVELEWVVATRIANASSFASILLLEAGGEPSVLNDIPAFDATSRTNLQIPGFIIPPSKSTLAKIVMER
ncbi:hypothetical protein Ocin01_18625 [Orchesella cincta]|uniref:Uncharacterized protein n=1 Tax=Orchesella cincta TaxID=48709 RepID=A0A1D2M4Z3_ORCCI|nr:hypothetical protein Ocin01_18625 [Orchesella cincta]